MASSAADHSQPANTRNRSARSTFATGAANAAASAVTRFLRRLLLLFFHGYHSGRGGGKGDDSRTLRSGPMAREGGRRRRCSRIALRFMRATMAPMSVLAARSPIVRPEVPDLMARAHAI